MTAGECPSVLRFAVAHCRKLLQEYLLPFKRLRLGHQKVINPD